MGNTELTTGKFNFQVDGKDSFSYGNYLKPKNLNSDNELVPINK